MEGREQGLEDTRPAVPPESPRLGWMSWMRIVGLGLLCTAVGALWEQQAQLLRGTCHVAESVPPLSAVAALIFLLALQRLLRWLGNPLGLSRAEILCTYAFVCIAVTIGFIGLFRQMLCLLSMPVYGPQEDSTVSAIRPHLPGWLFPTDPEVIRKMWEGSKGEGVPWKAWLVPLAFLGALFTAFFFTTACLIGLFHRRWSRDERLRYPVAELAVEVVGREEGAGPAVLLKSQMFWLGALGALLFNLYFIIPSLDPLWPVPRSQYDFHDLGLDLPWKAGGPGPYLRLNPLFFGLGFLVPLDLLLTVWVMVIVLKIEAVVASTFGVPYYPLFHIRFQQGMGAYVGLALVMLWAGRRYTLSALGDFFRRPGKIDPDGPGKWTLVGLAGGTAFLLVFFIRVGMVAWFAVLFLALVLVRVLVMARVRAQAGIPNIYLHVVEIRSFVWMLGGGTLAALGEVTLAALVFLSFLIWCTYVTPYQADGFRIAEITGLGGRRWIWLSTLAAASGFALASFFQIHALYAEGFGTLRQPLSIWPANEIFNAARASDPIDPLRLTLMAVGLATTAGLALLQGVWHWFPFSPLGFVVACAIGDYVGAMLLITWLVKRCVLKFGGAPAYQAARTSCIGLVFAHLTIAALWGLLGLFDLPPTKRYVIGFW